MDEPDVPDKVPGDQTGIPPKGPATNRQSERYLAVRIGSLVASLYFFDQVFIRFGTLPESSYFESTIIEAVAARLFALKPSSLIVGGMAVVALAVAIRRRSMGPQWSDYEFGSRIRLLVVFVAAVLAWFYATYDSNLYFGQSHAVDRLVLIALVPLVFWRPVIVFPMLLLLIPIVSQFNVPLAGGSWSEPVLLIRVLELLLSLVVARWIVRMFRHPFALPTGPTFVFVLCCLIASHYWVSGLGKLELGWYSVDHIYYLLPATYSAGWLGFLEPDRVASIASGLAALNGPMKIWTLIVECGALICLLRRGTMRFFLVGWVTLHIGIFLTTGILFWRWIVLDVAVLLIFFLRPGFTPSIFTRTHSVLSVVLIAGGSVWFGPVKLAWYDVPSNYSYRVYADASDGNTYRLPPRFFSPYDYQFTLTAFNFAAERPVLDITWGSTQRRDLAVALSDATSPATALEIEDRLGRVRYNVRRRADLKRFLRTYTTNWNARREGHPAWGRRSEWWRFLQAPSQLWTFPRSDDIPAGVSIETIRLRRVFAFFDGAVYHEISDQEVLSVIPDR